MTRTLRIALLVGLVVAFGSFLRLYDLDQLPPGLYPDEAMNGNNALEALRTAPPTGGFKAYYPENNGREGLFINIQALFLKYLVPANGGLTEPWMLRLPSAMFGILTILGLFFLGRELFRGAPHDDMPGSSSSGSVLGVSRGEAVGLLASFFIATSFWHVMFSRIGFRAIAAPFFLTWALALLLIALRKGGGRQPLFAVLLALVAGLLFGCGFHTYIAYRVAPLLFLAVIPFFHRTPYFWKVIAFFLLGAFLAGAPIGLYYLEHPADFFGRTSQISVISSDSPLRDLGTNVLKTVGMFFVSGDRNPRHNLPGEPSLFWLVAALFLVGIGAGLANLLRRGGEGSLRFGYLVSFLWLGLAALPVVISNEGLPHALRGVLMIPPAMLFSAAGAVVAYRRIVAFVGARYPAWAVRSFVPALIGAAFITLVVQAPFTYFYLWANHPDTRPAFAADYVDVGRAVRDLPRGTPKFVVIEAGGVDVRGIPMPAQTVMFITDSFTPDRYFEKTIYYVAPKESGAIPKDAHVFVIK